MLFLGGSFDATSTSRGASGASCGRFWHVPAACWSHFIQSLERRADSSPTSQPVSLTLGSEIRRSGEALT